MGTLLSSAFPPPCLLMTPPSSAWSMPIITAIRTQSAQPVARTIRMRWVFWPPALPSKACPWRISRLLRSDLARRLGPYISTCRPRKTLKLRWLPRLLFQYQLGVLQQLLHRRIPVQTACRRRPCALASTGKLAVDPGTLTLGPKRTNGFRRVLSFLSGLRPSSFPLPCLQPTTAEMACPKAIAGLRLTIIRKAYDPLMRYQLHPQASEARADFQVLADSSITLALMHYESPRQRACFDRTRDRLESR